MIKNRKWINTICIGMITVILLALFLPSLKLTFSKPTIPLTVEVTNGEIKKEIKPWYDDKGTWYFFLPSYTDFDSAILRTQEKNCFIDGVPLKPEQKLDFAEPEREYGFEQHFFRNEEKSKIVFMKSAGVASMYIDTWSGKMDQIYADKDHKEYVSVKLFNEAGEISYISEHAARLKGRGNGTWVSPKKPFLLSLSDAAPLLGMKKAVKWVLLANSFDKTNLRNKLIYDFASKVNMGWTPHCEFTDLYLNGEYNGLYLLSEKVEVADNRLLLNDLRNDYLFEQAPVFRLEKGDIAFQISDQQCFVIDYPAECDAQRLAEIEQDVYQLDKQINTGDLTGIDLDSWVKRFLIDEVFINYDAIDASNFFHYDTASGKFYAGPIWDYDLALGSDATEWTVRSKNPKQIWGLKKSWYTPLYQNDTFYEKVRQVYREEFLPELEKMLTYELPYQSGRIHAANICNSIRWDDVFQIVYFFGDKELEERLNELSRFLEERLDYLASVWLSGKEFEIVRWYEADKTTPLDVTPVEHGTAITDFPTENDEMIYDWYNVSNDDAFDAAQPVTASLELYSKSAGVPEEQSRISLLMEWLALNEKNLLLSALCVMIAFSGAVLLYIDIRRNWKGGRHGK